MIYSKSFMVSPQETMFLWDDSGAPVADAYIICSYPKYFMYTTIYPKMQLAIMPNTPASDNVGWDHHGHKYHYFNGYEYK